MKCYVRYNKFLLKTKLLSMLSVKDGYLYISKKKKKKKRLTQIHYERNCSKYKEKSKYIVRYSYMWNEEYN